jgi:hypothetical protein
MGEGEGEGLMAPPEAAALGLAAGSLGEAATVAAACALGSEAAVVDVHAASIAIASTAASLMHPDNGTPRPPLREVKLPARILSSP